MSAIPGEKWTRPTPQHRDVYYATPEDRQRWRVEEVRERIARAVGRRATTPP